MLATRVAIKEAKSAQFVAVHQARQQGTTWQTVADLLGYASRQYALAKFGDWVVEREV